MIPNGRNLRLKVATIIFATSILTLQNTMENLLSAAKLGK